MCVCVYKDHVTLKTGVMMLKNQLWHHRDKLHFKIYLKKKKNVIIFYNITVFYFIFDQIHAALVSIRDIKKSPTQNLVNVPFYLFYLAKSIPFFLQHQKLWLGSKLVY